MLAYLKTAFWLLAKFWVHFKLFMYEKQTKARYSVICHIHIFGGQDTMHVQHMHCWTLCYIYSFPLEK